MRTRLLLLLALALLVLGPLRANAEWPERSIQVIVPFPPGGAVDSIARQFAQSASGELGQTIVVVNRDGASGMIGSKVLATSAPDGYTMGIFPNGPLTIQPSLSANAFLPAERLHASLPIVDVHLRTHREKGQSLSDSEGIGRGRAAVFSAAQLWLRRGRYGPTLRHVRAHRGDKNKMDRGPLSRRAPFGWRCLVRHGGCGCGSPGHSKPSRLQDPGSVLGCACRGAARRSYCAGRGSRRGRRYSWSACSCRQRPRQPSPANLAGPVPRLPQAPLSRRR